MKKRRILIKFDSGNFFRVFSVSGNFRKVRSGIKNSGHLGDTIKFHV